MAKFGNKGQKRPKSRSSPKRPNLTQCNNEKIKGQKGENILMKAKLGNKGQEGQIETLMAKFGS